jgi:hypothetical protein
VVDCGEVVSIERVVRQHRMAGSAVHQQILAAQIIAVDAEQLDEKKRSKHYGRRRQRRKSYPTSGARTLRAPPAHLTIPALILPVPLA